MNTNEPCAAVFPVDEDFMRLPNNDVIQLEGRQQKITYYLTLGGWNISSPNHIINVIDKFDFSQLDVLVLVNSYHFLEHRVIEDIIRIAAQNNIEIYWARDDRDVDRQAIEEMSDELKVCTSFICNEVAADISTVLHNFDIPIVSIAGVGPYVQKFQVGLKLRNDFVSAGYKTLYISSRREGVLFGARIFPEFLFENGMSFSEKIYGINHYIEKLCREEQPDVVLISVPGETMELSQKHKLDFGYLASIVFSAIKPDVSILNLYNLKYTDEFLEEQKSYCKYRFGAVPDLFYATYTGIVESSLQEAWIQYYHGDKIYDDLLTKNKLFNEADVMNGLFFERVMEILEEYGSLDFMQSKLCKDYFRSVETGKTIKNLAQNYISDMPIYVPDIIEQKRIIDKVEPILDKIFALKKSVESKRSIIDAVFKEYFGYDYDKFESLKTMTYYSSYSQYGNNIDTRFSAKFHRPAGEFVYQELNSRPNKKIKKLLILPMITGQGIATTDYDENGDYAYVSMADISSWSLNLNDIKYVSNDYAKKKLTKKIKGNKTPISTEIGLNDILLMRSGEGGIGKVAIVEDDAKGIFCDFIIRMRFDENQMNPLFAYYYFCTRYFQYLVEINKKGLGNNTNIFPNQIQEFPIPYISLNEQKLIVDSINAELEKQKVIDKKIMKEREKIEKILAAVIA